MICIWGIYFFFFYFFSQKYSSSVKCPEHIKSCAVRTKNNWLLPAATSRGDSRWSPWHQFSQTQCGDTTTTISGGACLAPPPNMFHLWCHHLVPPSSYATTWWHHLNSCHLWCHHLCHHLNMSFTNCIICRVIIIPTPWNTNEWTTLRVLTTLPRGAKYDTTSCWHQTIHENCVKK